jgi:Coenzyme PQQ synthesis protein D (PqqD)
MSDESPRYHRSSHVLWRRTLDTLVLLPVTSDDEPFALAATGPELWGLLAEPRSLDDLVGRLAEAHAVDPYVVAADVEPLLERLLALGAIQRV